MPINHRRAVCCVCIATLALMASGSRPVLAGPPRPGFWVDGRDLYDHLGERVVLRGVNKMNVWTDRAGDSFSEISKTGANTVRIVWAMDGGDWVPTAADLDRVIGRAIDNQLIPMIELHDATGNWPLLDTLVDYWVQPAIVAVIEKYARHLLVNIGNEVGDWTITADQFFDGYAAAVARMRAAGIDTTLVIDAPDYGKNLDVLTAAAPSLLDADPNHNLLFSVHLYWPKNFGADPDFIRTNLQAAVDAGYALVVGEFSRYGAYAGEASICSAAGETEYRVILEECDRHRIGWYAWEWGPGNVGGGDPLCTVMDMTTESTLNSLQPGWATEVVYTSPYGIAATSVIPQSIRGSDPDPTPTPTHTPPATATATPTRPRPCTGDCSGDQRVTVDELVWGINIAIGDGLVDTCEAFDARGDGGVTVDELLAAVNAALHGCSASVAAVTR